MMQTRYAYCSACDQQVEVVVNPDLPEDERLEPSDPGELLCLEYSKSCTGAMCPLFGVTTEEMRLRYLDATSESGPEA